MLKNTNSRLAVLVLITLSITTAGFLLPGIGIASFTVIGEKGPLAYTEIAVLRPAIQEFAAAFGNSVALDGDTLVIGAVIENGGAGAVYIFERDHGGPENWGQVTVLTADDPGYQDNFGGDVAISGDVIAVGAIREDGGPGDPQIDSGAVYVFERDLGGPDNWGQAALLHASDGQDEDYFSQAVDLSGDTLVVGAWAEDGGDGDPSLNVGAGYVFERDQGGTGTWGEVLKLATGSAPPEGYFGWSVAVQGDTAAVSAPATNFDTGVVYVFDRDQGGADEWGQVTILVPGLSQGGQLGFGDALALDASTLLVGAHNEADSAGAAYVFDRDQGGPDNWGQTAHLTAADAQSFDSFGYSVALNGERALIGAFGESGGPGDPINYAGAAYVFERDLGGTGHWGQVAKLAAGDAQETDLFGWSVALIGNTVAVGAIGEDGGPGNPSENLGAVYIYMAGPEPTATPTGTPTPSQTATATPTATPTVTPTQGRVTKTPTPGSTNTPGPSPTSGGGGSTPTPAVTNTPFVTHTPVPGDSVHVSDLDGSAAPNGPNRWDATVTITIVDQNGASVAGATVSGAWSSGAAGSGSCQTDAAGQCSITRSLIRNLAGSVTFTMDDVNVPGYGYDPGANGDPDGDSDGTVIVVIKP